jgi:adenylate cyclase class 2
MVEVERKFKISDLSAITKHVQSVAKLSHKALRQVDTIYLQGIDSFADFSPTDPVVRIRQIGDTCQLTYKRRLGENGNMLEHELNISDETAMKSILQELDFRQVTLVEKVRTEYIYEDVVVAIDKVHGLGSYVELEVLAKVHEIASAEEKIETVRRLLKLRSTDLEPRKYDQLVSQL